MSKEALRTALLISGRGTTAQAVVEASRTGELEGKILPVAIISSSKDALGIDLGRKQNIPVYVIPRRDYQTSLQFGIDLLSLLLQLHVDVVSQNGWLPLTPKMVVATFRGRLINQHPGPLDPGFPDFGGQGMYGRRVTAAVIAYSWVSHALRHTEATTHHVSNEYDKGAIINVKTLDLPGIEISAGIEEVLHDPHLRQQLIEVTHFIQDTLLPLEHQNVISTLSHMADGEIPNYVRPERLILAGQESVLESAKITAKELFPQG